MPGCGDKTSGSRSRAPPHPPHSATSSERAQLPQPHSKAGTNGNYPPSRQPFAKAPELTRKRNSSSSRVCQKPRLRSSSGKDAVLFPHCCQDVQQNIEFIPGQENSLLPTHRNLSNGKGREHREVRGGNLWERCSSAAQGQVTESQNIRGWKGPLWVI